tara:strand:- start:2058 stop:2528 length:471 start_codon:yes stop_codon:yes gene_type:complete
MLMNVEMLEIIAFFDLIPLTMSARLPDQGAISATVTIADDAISSGGKSWRLGEIADFNVRRGSRINANEPPPVVQRTRDGGRICSRKSTSAMFSHALNRWMIDCSYLVSLRCARAQGAMKQFRVSGGLALDCAEALQRDLREALSTNAKVSSGGVA